MNEGFYFQTCDVFAQVGNNEKVRRGLRWCSFLSQEFLSRRGAVWQFYSRSACWLNL